MISDQLVKKDNIFASTKRQKDYEEIVHPLSVGFVYI